MKNLGKLAVAFSSIVIACVLFLVLTHYSLFVASIAAALAVGVGLYTLFTKKHHNIVHKVIAGTAAVALAAVVFFLLVKSSTFIAVVITVVSICTGLYITLNERKTA